METIKEKKLKEIKKQIWWIETKIAWLRFMSGKIIGSNSYNPALLYIPIAAFLFVVYIVLDKFFISEILIEKQLRVCAVIVLIVVFCFLAKIVEEKAFSRIEFLEQKLTLLQKQKSSLFKTHQSTIIN